MKKKNERKKKEFKSFFYIRFATEILTPSSEFNMAAHRLKRQRQRWINATIRTTDKERTKILHGTGDTHSSNKPFTKPLSLNGNETNVFESGELDGGG